MESSSAAISCSALSTGFRNIATSIPVGSAVVVMCAIPAPRLEWAHIASLIRFASALLATQPEGPVRVSRTMRTGIQSQAIPEWAARVASVPGPAASLAADPAAGAATTAETGAVLSMASSNSDRPGLAEEFPSGLRDSPYLAFGPVIQILPGAPFGGKTFALDRMGLAALGQGTPGLRPDRCNRPRRLAHLHIRAGARGVG